MDTFGLKGKSKANDDVFFMERLEMLYEQGLVELRAFAERENRSFDEVSRSGDGECKGWLVHGRRQVRRRMAELHCKSLFDASRATGTEDPKELSPSFSSSPRHLRRLNYSQSTMYSNQSPRSLKHSKG